MDEFVNGISVNRQIRFTETNRKNQSLVNFLPSELLFYTPLTTTVQFNYSRITVVTYYVHI